MRPLLLLNAVGGVGLLLVVLVLPSHVGGGHTGAAGCLAGRTTTTTAAAVPSTSTSITTTTTEASAYPCLPHEELQCSGCEASCDVPNPPASCVRHCSVGDGGWSCQCKRGYARGGHVTGYQCIPKGECQNACPPNESKQCTGCEQDCYLKRGTDCVPDCSRHDCVCKQGFARSAAWGNYSCVPSEECLKHPCAKQNAELRCPGCEASCSLWYRTVVPPKPAACRSDCGQSQKYCQCKPGFVADKGWYVPPCITIEKCDNNRWALGGGGGGGGATTTTAAGATTSMGTGGILQHPPAGVNTTTNDGPDT